MRSNCEVANGSWKCLCRSVESDLNWPKVEMLRHRSYHDLPKPTRTWEILNTGADKQTSRFVVSRMTDATAFCSFEEVHFAIPMSSLNFGKRELLNAPGRNVCRCILTDASAEAQVRVNDGLRGGHKPLAALI